MFILLAPILKAHLLASVLCFLFYGLQATAASNAPDQVFDVPRVFAVEPRLYNPRYDLTGQVGVLPLDAFWKGISVGASYTHTFTSAWSWEAFNGNLNFKSDTNLKNDLINKFNVRPTGVLDHVTWFATSNVIFSPIYSKNLLFNKYLVHGSLSFVAGGGVAAFSNNDTAILYGGGFILRFFQNRKFSHKIDTRLYAHNAQGRSSNMLLTVVYGLSFEFGDHKQAQD